MLKTWIPGVTSNLQDQGLSGTSWINDNVTVVSGGKLGNCMSFDGSTSRLSTTGYSLSGKWSFSCWVKDDALTTSWQMVLGLNGNGGDSDVQMGLWVKPNEGLIKFNYNGSYQSAIPYISGQWNHFTGTCDGVATLFYINGNLVSTNANSNSLMRTNLTIGGASTNADGGGHISFANSFKGWINDVRIWDDEAITPSYIKRLSQGLLLHYKLSRDGCDNIVLDSTDQTQSTEDYMVKSYTLSSNLVSGRTYTWSMKANLSSERKWIGIRIGDAFTAGDKQRNENGYYYETFVATAQQAGYTTINVYSGSEDGDQGSVPIQGTAEIAWIKIEEGSRPTSWVPNSADDLYTVLGFNDGIEHDCSGFGNNGTKIGSLTYTPDTPRYTTSTHIGSTSQKIHIDNISTSGFADSFSVAWWGKRTSNSSMFWGFSDGDRLNGMYMGTLWDSADNPLYNVETTTQVTAPSTSTWHHYVMTGNGIKCHVYLDGQLWAEAKTYNSLSGTSIYINGWQNTSEYSSDDADISDFRIYATALSSDDVKDLYSLGGSLDSSGTFRAYEYVE